MHPGQLRRVDGHQVLVVDRHKCRNLEEELLCQPRGPHETFGSGWQYDDGKDRREVSASVCFFSLNELNTVRAYT